MVLLAVVGSFLVGGAGMIGFTASVAVRLALVFLLVTVMVTPLVTPFIAKCIGTGCRPYNGGAKVFPKTVCVGGNVGYGGRCVSHGRSSTIGWLGVLGRAIFGSKFRILSYAIFIGGGFLYGRFYVVTTEGS